jgi:L-erythro-3,5-diaminohexanoate dehydrogenase
MEFLTGGQDLGVHRVIEPAAALPQAALRLDASAPAYDNEIVIDVQTLNIDSASFHQISEDVGGKDEAIAHRIESIVSERGKMQNPVTGSGGMLLGTVAARGPKYRGDARLGDRVATLVSLTLTPLSLDSIDAVHAHADQVDVAGRAYLWPSSTIAVLPHDIPVKLALSVMDVCGAPAQTRRLAANHNRILILGAGKSGMLSAIAARDVLGKAGRIDGFDLSESNLSVLQEHGILDDYRCGNALDPQGVLQSTRSMSGAEGYDLVINTCNVPSTEMSAILCCRDRGTVYFFNMATDFAKAALGAEGIGRDVNLLIGNGYAHGHADYSLDLVRRYPFIGDHLNRMLRS